MKEKIVGIDIDEDCISIASAIVKDGALSFDTLCVQEYASGSSAHAVASIIKRLWKTQRIKAHTVCSCLRSPSLTLKYFKFPELTHQEAEAALRLEAEQMLHKPQRELFIDWHFYTPLASTDKNQGIPIPEGILVAAPAEAVKKHLAVLAMANLYPVVLDIGCMAIGNAFLALSDSKNKTDVCLVNVGNQSVDVAVLSQDSHLYPRMLSLQSVALEEKVDYVMCYVKEVLRYAEYKLRKKPVNRIVFTGKICADSDFQKRLKNASSVPVAFWNPLDNVVKKNNTGAQKQTINGLAMSVCLGMALRNNCHEDTF